MPAGAPRSGPPPENYRAEDSTGPNPVLDFDPVPAAPPGRSGRFGARGGAAGPARGAAEPSRPVESHAPATGRPTEARGRGRRVGVPGPRTRGRMTRCPVTRPPPTRSWARPRAFPANPADGAGRPGRVGAWASAREPTSTRNCGRRRRSAASATSSSGMTWRRTSRSPRPRAPPSRTRRAGTGRPLRAGPAIGSRATAWARHQADHGPQAVQAQASDDRKRHERGPAAGAGRHVSGPARPRPTRGRTDGDAARLRSRRTAYAARSRSRAEAAASRPRPSLSGAQPAGRPSRARPTPSLARPPASRPGRRPAAETRRRRPSSADEDPLTSAAFSLRTSGPVDGRSSLRARNGSADRYDTSSRGGTSPYPYSTSSYGDSSSVTQTMNTPPYGENYGYGSGGPAAQASDPRRQNGTGSHARPDGTGEGHQGRAAGVPAGQPPDRRLPAEQRAIQATAATRANGYPGNGYQGNGHRAPYDPRDDYRRLTHQH